MKIKKYLIGFIIAIISIIPISNIKALTIDNRNYDLPDLPNSYAETYPYTIAKDKNNEIYLIFFTDDQTVTDIDNSTATYYNNGVTLGGGILTHSIYSYHKNVRYYKLENNEWVYKNTGSYSVINYGFEDIGITQEEFRANPTIVKPFLQDKILYTNVNYFVCDGKPSLSKNCTLYFSNEDLKPQEYISFEYEIKETEDGNYSYYNIRVFTNNYNEEYEYLIKFDDEPFQDISMYLDDEEGIYYTIPYNTTMYLWVRDLSNETIETKTMTFSSLIDIDEYYSPTIDFNIGCNTGYEDNIEKAHIDLIFNNYSTNYKYQYSFNNIDFIDISYEDVKNKTFTITTYVNTSIFVRILDNNENIIFKNDSIVNCILDSEQYYYYQLTLDDLYDPEKNELIYYTFYYENIKRDFKPFVYFFYTGTEQINFHITYDTGATNFNMHYNALLDKTLENLPCTTLPFEYVENFLINNNYTTYTMFSFMPCIDLSTFLYGEQYTDFKLIVKSNIKLDIGEPIYFGGAFYPSTNKPLDKSDSFQSNYINFFNVFNNGFNRFKDVIIEFFQNITYFFSNLDSILQDFYIVIFVLILFIFIIKFIL